MAEADGLPGARAAGADTVRIRRYTRDDYPALVRLQRDCFPPPFPQHLLWTPEQIASHQRVFPEGALCAECDGVIVGSATAHRRRWHPDDPPHTWAEASADGFLSNHDPHGNVLYGVDIAVSPAHRRRGVASALYQARYQLVRTLDLTAFLAGSRLSGYHLVAGELTLEAYAQQVIAGTRHDPVITPQLRAGLRPLQLLHGYLSDQESGDGALLMAWMPPARALP